MKTAKPKLWTERRAWLYLAGRWDKAKQGQYVGTPWRADVLGDTFDGLCWSIGKLPLSEEVRESMMGKVPPRRDDDGYAWPLNAKGAKLRAEFCRKQAKECSR